MGMRAPSIALVTRETRLQALKARWGTAGQAKFRLNMAHQHERALRQQIVQQNVQPNVQQNVIPQSKSRGPVPQAQLAQQQVAVNYDTAAADFDAYEDEDAAWQRTLDTLEKELDFGLPITRLSRELVTNYDFWNTAVVVVVGPDGLVANTAKYVGDVPIVAVNPDPARIDGVLLPFQVAGARHAVRRVLDNRYQVRKVTLAEAQLNDGQRMLAFNDFFIGAASHVSARYTLELEGRSEPQSSSGVLVSTGAGSTGWLSSVFKMTAGISQWQGVSPADPLRLEWEDRRLMWAVREPFASKHSRADMVAGYLSEGRQLVLESLMPSGGVIFSDGIEQDFLPFTSGTIVRISTARQVARLVVD